MSDLEQESSASNAVEMLFPAIDLQAQFASIRDEVMEAVQRVMASQQFILGREVDSFEKAIAEFTATRAAVGCASGSDALTLALMALGVRPGDEVVTTPFTFVATAGSVARLGARPTFADIQADTFNLDPDAVAAAINGRTRAIIAVHLFGMAADLEPILKTARDHRIPVIEDAAQAIGARYKGVPVGGLGILGCFSFFPSKNLGGAGDGGLITTNDDDLASQLRMLRSHGSGERYHYSLLGLNSRLDALQAAVLEVKLRHLPDWTRKRRGKADRYRQLFAEKRLDGRVQLPTVVPDSYHVYNQFVIKSVDRDRLRQFLLERGIPTEVYYPRPLHLQPALAHLGYSEGDFPNAEAAAREVLALPIYPEIRDEHQATVVDAISEFCARQR